MMVEHTAPISGLSCNQGFVATAGYDNRVILWDGELNQALSRGWHDHLVNHCDFSPDKSKLLTSSSDYSSRVWSLPDMRLIHVNTNHTDDVVRGYFSPCGQYYATCSYDCTIKIYNLENKMTADLRGHTGIIENFCWSHDSKFIYSCGTDSKLIKWDAFSGVQIQIFENDGPDMDAIAILHNGKIVVGNDHGELCIFSKDLNLIRTYKAHESGIKNVILYEQSNNILTVGYGGFAKVLNMNDTITELATTELPSSIWARSADFYSDDTIVFGTFASKYANGVSRRDVGIFLKWKVRFHSIL